VDTTTIIHRIYPVRELIACPRRTRRREINPMRIRRRSLTHPDPWRLAPRTERNGRYHGLLSVVVAKCLTPSNRLC
jgi:hypothetical protein